MPEFSEEFKAKRRGGKREGAGRKPNYLRRLSNPVTAAFILAQIDEIKAWTELLSAEVPVTAGGRVVGHAPDLKIRMEALKYLTDRRDGKAKQALEHTGEDRGAIAMNIEEVHLRITQLLQEAASES